jgi:hypothetical protein
MRISKEDLDTKVVVRRVALSAAPFAWEVIGANSVTPIYSSPERFRSMDAAYQAGQKRFAEFLPSARQKPAAKRPASQAAPRRTANYEWQTYDDVPDEIDTDDELDVDVEMTACDDTQPDQTASQLVSVNTDPSSLPDICPVAPE